MAKQPNPTDVLHLGPQIASIKANMPKRRWTRLVKYAHARGHTIAGELSNQPDALKERTTASLRAEAGNSVARAYAPAKTELNTRQAAIGILDQKRKADDAAYNTWLSGETAKLDAQQTAANTVLATQQQSIADSASAAITAARADSLKRVSAAAGNVSDPTQSAALDTSAADTASLKNIGTAQAQTATLAAVGANSAVLAKASLLAQQGARAASNDASTWKAIGEVATDRNTLNSNEAAAKLDRFGQLEAQNISVAQATRDSELAGASLGLKRDDLAAQIGIANQKYKVAQAKFGLDKWKAQNANTVAQAKLQLGYDQIKSREGIAAANRKLNEKLTKIRAKQQQKTAGGVTKDERNLYKDVTSAQGRITRWRSQLHLNDDQIKAKLRGLGADDATINVAMDLVNNNGQLSPAGAAQARKLGVKHTGYFWTIRPAQDTLGGSGHL